MTNDIFGRIFANQWVVCLLTAVLLLALAEAGFRLGLRLHAAKDQARKGPIGGIQGAVLGLLGLLLAFTFSIAVERYNTRRHLVLLEANNIGTTYLRGSLLPDGHQGPVKDLLRRYVDVRLKYQPLADDPAMFGEGIRSSAEIQTELWKHATEAAKEAPNPITATFIESLNETIDSDSKRITAGRAGIPSGVWLLVVMVAAFACITTGYGVGAEGARATLGSVFLPLLITAVIVLIFDLSHPRQGLIGISQQPLIDLQQSMRPNQQ
jgi:hypothetical protein